MSDDGPRAAIELPTVATIGNGYVSVRIDDHVSIRVPFDDKVVDIARTARLVLSIPIKRGAPDEQ
jgi:hypothetical protein